MDEPETLLARRLSRGKGKYKGKLPLICFKCNEVGHFAAKYPNRNTSDKNDKKNFKYRKNRDYKDKGKKSCYIAEEEHTESNSNDDKGIVEIVYVAIKEDPNGERYESENAIISHVSNSDSWIIDSGCLHHMTRDLSKFDKFEEIDDGRIVKLGNDVSCLVKGK